jgi:hypothetical protein
MRDTISILSLLGSLLGSASGANIIRLNNRTGSTLTDYPVQIGRPFVQGEISNYPQIGRCSDPACSSVSWLDTSHYQSDVKVRWADGSVKHAVISFVVSTLPAGNAYFTFRNSPTGNNTPLDKTAMLDGRYDFDATMKATFAGLPPVTVSARSILAAHSGPIPDCETLNWATATGTTTCYWLKGPINTTVVLADHSAARAYDFGSDGNRSVRPIFHAAFWPTVNKVHLRFIAENANTQTLQEQDYDISLSSGQASPVTVYSKTALSHYPATRWTKSDYWIGPAPPKEIDIDSNLSYLISTSAVPNYDTSKHPSESAIANRYNQWVSSSHDLYDVGNWSYKAMGTAGGRPSIGPYPTWDVLWLYTGDYRLREVATGNTDLAAAWPFYFREAVKAGLGKPISIQDRPTVFLGSGNSYITYSYTNATDKITPIGTLANGGWTNDSAHLYQPHYLSYLLMGDYFYLEEMWFWASWGLFDTNFTSSYSYGRGPTGSGCIHGQPRGDAWTLRSRAEFAWIAPDAMPEKGYYSNRVIDALACWEGERSIKGTALQSHPSYIWAASFAGTSTLWSGKGVPPLHFWEYNTGLCQSPCNSSVALAGTSPWMENFLAYSLNRVYELGFPSAPLRSWLALSLTGMVNNPGAISPYSIGTYRVPTASKASGTWYESWADVAGGYVTGYDPQPDFDSYLTDAEHGYSYIAQAALASFAADPGGSAAWAWIAPKTANQAILNDNPKWAIVPRQNPATPSTNPCDVNGDGLVNALDYTATMNQLLSPFLCSTGDVNKSGFCDALDLQIVTAAITSGTCPSR